MERFTSVHSSDVDATDLQRAVAAQADDAHGQVFRRLLLRRLLIIAAAVWTLSWPLHVLPHAALWVVLGIVAIAAAFS